MLEMGASADWAAAAALILLSFGCFVAGTIFRKWPEKVREYVETIDGSVMLLTREAHQAMIITSAWGLTVVSLAALVAAALIL
jgi:hypothetical protein